MNLITVLKKFTLPISMLVGVVVYMLFAYVPVLESSSNLLGPMMEKILPLFMFLILFVVFCKIDFRKLLPVRWHFWVGVQQIAFVLFFTGLILGFKLQGFSLVLTEGILTCIIGPCASASSVVTAKLGGNLESMTTYTFLSNFITVALVPVVFPMIEPHTHIVFWDSFSKIFFKVGLILLVPMVGAYIVKHYMHRFHRWVVSVKDLSFYMWGLTLMIVTGTTAKNIMNADTPVSHLLIIAALSLLLCLVQFGMGRWIGRHFGAEIEGGQALGQKNTAFAIWVANTYLNPLSSVGPGCYILWQNTVNSIELWAYEKKRQVHESPTTT